MSGVLSAALFAFDYSWIPQANQIQDAILNEIKGRPAQTYLHPERKWIIHDYRIFYIKYFDPSEKVMVEPYVFELDPKTFHVLREISANRARWQQNIKHGSGNRAKHATSAAWMNAKYRISQPRLFPRSRKLPTTS